MKLLKAERGSKAALQGPPEKRPETGALVPRPFARRWEDFDKDALVLHVRRQWLASGVYGPPKTKAGTRRIALPSDLRDELIALRLRSDFLLDGDPVFASLQGTPLGHRNVLRRGFESARDAAKLPSSLTLHDLRHAAASRLINARLDPVTVAAVLGARGCDGDVEGVRASVGSGADGR